MTKFMQFGWVPDGTYDHREFLVRYVIKNGNSTTVLSKDWVESGIPKSLPQVLGLPWETYPDVPPKVKK
jgi:hypothetical protein